MSSSGILMASSSCGAGSSSYLLFRAETRLPAGARAALYALALAYCFLGLSSITARFFRSMEQIMRHTREVVVVVAATDGPDDAPPVVVRRRETAVPQWHGVLTAITILSGRPDPTRASAATKRRRAGRPGCPKTGTNGNGAVGSRRDWSVIQGPRRACSPSRDFPEAMDAAAAAAAPPPGAPSFSYLAVFSNCPLVAAVLAFAIAQSIKVFTTWYKENRWDAKQLVGSGGMPSSHSATVTALAVAVGLREGFASSLFATAAVFASVVMYDAFGVRLHAGKQAEVLNQIVYELPSEHPLAETRPLRELLGHTPPQVLAGGVLGFAVATFTAMIAGLGS